MAERLLITGISGFVGRAIARQALGAGYEVSGIDRAGLQIDGVNVVNADIRDREAMLKLTKGVDFVVHLAAITSNLEFEKNMPRAYDVNVNGFNTIIEAAYTNHCKKFLYASSSAVYFDKFSEDAVIDIAKMKNHYAKTKLINEAVGRSYRSNSLLDAVGMRFFNVYGPGENEKGDYASIVTIFRKLKKENKPLRIYGDGKQSRDLIYVTDVAKVCMQLLKKSRQDVYNVGTGMATSYNEIADMIAPGKKAYVDNPLSTYQMLTKADTARLLGDIGRFDFVKVSDGIRMME